MRNGLEARVQEIDHTIFLDPEITPVVVGERDIKQNGDMRATAKVDSYQGYSRLERGRNWIEAMQHAAAAHGLATRYEFKTLPRSKHLFRQCMKRGDMGRIAFEFLFDESRHAR